MFCSADAKAKERSERGRGSDGRGTSKGQMHRSLSFSPLVCSPPFETRTPRNPPPRIKAVGRYPPTRSRNPAPPFYPTTASHKLEILKYVRAGRCDYERRRQAGRTALAKTKPNAVTCCTYGRRTVSLARPSWRPRITCGPQITREGFDSGVLKRT